MAWPAAAAALLLAAAVLSPAAVASASNAEGDALYALRRALADPKGVLQSWDPTLVSPCTWFHVLCNEDNRVIRVSSKVARQWQQLEQIGSLVEQISWLAMPTSSATVSSSTSQNTTMLSTTVSSSRTTTMAGVSFAAAPVVVGGGDDFQFPELLGIMEETSHHFLE